MRQRRAGLRLPPSSALAAPGPRRDAASAALRHQTRQLPELRRQGRAAAVGRGRVVVHAPVRGPRWLPRAAVRPNGDQVDDAGGVGHGRRHRDPLDGLTQIGVDELSYRRHHEYITVVVDHRRGHVVWARPGKNADTLKAFFDELGPKRCAKLEAITIDMSAAYIKAVTECSPQAQLIFDRFHVQRLAQDAVDEVRRDEVRAADSAEERKELKGTRWPLLKSFWNLSMFDSLRLAALQRENKRLYRAYLLKDSLVRVLDCKDEWLARTKLDQWIRWARHSRLEPFKRVAATIHQHTEGIRAYVTSGLSNGRTEGLNGKTRTLTRRAYGFHSAHGLIALIMLCCAGIHLDPVHHWPGSTH